VIAGLPLEPAQAGGSTGGVLQIGTFTVPDVNITIATYNWISLATRLMWQTFDVMFGAAALDTTAAVVLKAS
jgi:hypothetical protein